MCQIYRIADWWGFRWTWSYGNVEAVEIKNSFGVQRAGTFADKKTLEIGVLPFQVCLTTNNEC